MLFIIHYLRMRSFKNGRATAMSISLLILQNLMTYLASYLVIQVSFTIAHYENHTLTDPAKTGPAGPLATAMSISLLILQNLMTYLASYLVIQVSFTIAHYENHTLSVVYVLKYY